MISLALIVAFNERKRNARIAYTTGNIPNDLIPILAKLSLPREANRACVTVSLGEILVVSYPILINSTFGTIESLDMDTKKVEEGEEEYQSLVSFSTVFISKRHISIEPNIKHAAKMLGEALLLQEQIGNFVSEQVDLLQKQQQSILATLLSKITSDLRDIGRTHVELPGGVPLTLEIITRSSDLINGFSLGEVESPYMRPYHSLLLLRDAADIASIACITSPQILAVLQRATPTRSIHELQAECGLPASQLLRLAGHLVHHGLATIVDTISEESLIVLAPHSVPTFADSEAFKQAVITLALSENISEIQQMNLELVDFLALISRSASNGLTLRSLMSELIIPQSQQRNVKFDRIVIEAVVWLLKRNFIKQQHTYVLLLWPWVSINRHSDKHTTSNNTVVFDVMSGLSWTREEAEYANNLVVGKPTTIQSLFRRLLVFLRSAIVSESHLQEREHERSRGVRIEELLFKLRVSRVDLSVVIKSFPTIFVLLSA